MVPIITRTARAAWNSGALAEKLIETTIPAPNPDPMRARKADTSSGAKTSERISSLKKGLFPKWFFPFHSA